MRVRAEAEGQGEAGQGVFSRHQEMVLFVLAQRWGNTELHSVLANLCDLYVWGSAETLYIRVYEDECSVHIFMDVHCFQRTLRDISWLMPVRVNVSMFLSRPGLVFISAAAPTVFPSPPSLQRGPETTSLSVLPGLWNNNTPGFPITASPANGDRTENMCGQTGAWVGEDRRGVGRGGEGQRLVEQMAKVRPAGDRL